MRKIVMLIVSIALAVALHAADALPYGHKDFVPTPEQPIGYRGDGTGVFPGATPVTEFWEGTTVKKIGKNPPHRDFEYWVAEDDGKSKNILWKTEMPCWGNTGVIVVGKKVFTKAEPNLLVCVDADSGKILWTKAANAWEIGGVEKTLAEKLQTMHEIYLYAIPNWGAMLGNSTMTSNMPYDQFLSLTETFTKDLPKILAALKELDPGFNYEAAAKSSLTGIDTILSAKKENKWPEKPTSGALSDAISQRINDLGKLSFNVPTGKVGKVKRIGVPQNTPWGNLVGFCCSTPVSDGKLVYAVFGQGQVVAYDLDGNCVWARFILTPFTDFRTVTHYPSPVLADGILLVNQDPETLVGLDANTGKTVWSTPGAATPGGYSVGTPKVVTLTKGEEKLRVLVTESCKIVRISDGKIVGTLPWEHDKITGGPSITGVGDIVTKGSNGDGFHKPLTAFRLTLKDKDSVEAVKVKEIGGSDYAGIVVTDGLQPLGGRDGSILMAGKVLIHGSRSYYGAGSNFGQFTISQLQADGKEKSISKTNVLIHRTPRMPAMEKYAPELYKILPSFSGGMIGAPGFFSHVDTETTVQGDRLYIRSSSYLYCIGPEKKKELQDDPKVAAKISALTKVEDLLPLPR